jgi:hypothetical protein
MQVNAQQLTNHSAQLALHRVIKGVVPDRIEATCLRQDQEREVLPRAHVREQLTAATARTLRSTVNEVCRVQPEGIDHALRYRHVLVSARMTRRSEGDHLIVEREAGRVRGSQGCDCGEGFHGATQ